MGGGSEMIPPPPARLAENPGYIQDMQVASHHTHLSFHPDTRRTKGARVGVVALRFPSRSTSAVSEVETPLRLRPRIGYARALTGNPEQQILRYRSHG
ncbi:MAG TPA: hypothetical protein VI636_24840 [Candidatus Angelobacter sp.]